MRVLGLDPGLRWTGWGLVETGATDKATDYGVWEEDGKGSRGLARLYELVRGRLLGVDYMVLERAYVGRNADAALGVGQVRGACMAAAGSCGVRVEELSATHIKKALTGSGRADKRQVAGATRRFLDIRVGGEEISAHATDALAAALCGAWREGARRVLEAGRGAAEMKSD